MELQVPYNSIFMFFFYPYILLILYFKGGLKV
jgi:hypothetical protein